MSGGQIFSNADVVSNDRVVELVQRELISRAKLLGTIMNVSSFAQKGDKSIWFPKMPSFQVTKKLPGQKVQSQVTAMTYDEMALDQHAVIQWNVERRAGMQTPVDLESELLQKAVRAHAKGIDLDIFAKLVLTSASNPDHQIDYTGGVMGSETLAKGDILEAMALLENQGVDIEDEFGNVFLAVNPRQKKQLLLIDDFVSAERYASAMPIQRGVLGTLYGVVVISTPHATLDQSVLYHREACAFGLQMGPTLETSFDHSYISDLTTLDQLYGVKELNSGKLGVLIKKP